MIIWNFHALGCSTPGGRRVTSYDRLFQRILTTDYTVVELCGNWDLVKRWPRSNHSNAWDGHLVKNGMVTLRAPSVVMLKGGSGFRNDLRLGLTPVAKSIMELRWTRHASVRAV